MLTPTPLASDSSPSACTVPSAQSMLSVIQDDMRAMDELIRDRLHSDVALVRTIADYIISAGGKRLRPAVLLLVANALGCTDIKVRLTLATVVEFIHTATLLHDDVVDESDLRRGRPTANTAFGNAASVLVGDFLYSRAFQMMVDVSDSRVMKILADATNRIAEGEVLQLLNVHDPSISEQRYLQVVERKTATLFEAAAQIGAVISGASKEIEICCAQYGSALGIAFQIADDVLDYSGQQNELGKQIGDDLREGKATLPLIHALANAPTDQKQILETAIRDGGGDFSAIAQIIQSTGSLQYARYRAASEAERAQKLVSSNLPRSKFKDSLLDLSAFATARDT